MKDFVTNGAVVVEMISNFVPERGHTTLDAKFAQVASAALMNPDGGTVKDYAMKDVESQLSDDIDSGKTV